VGLVRTSAITVPTVPYGPAILGGIRDELLGPIFVVYVGFGKIVKQADRSSSHGEITKSNLAIIPYLEPVCPAEPVKSPCIDSSSCLIYRSALDSPDNNRRPRVPVMQLIVPDLFAEVSRLSVGACIVGLILGLLLWTTGWWQHRFWVVAFITAGAGVYGLQQGKLAGVQPLVAGLLAAMAAGWMAVELAKVLAFIGGGAAGNLFVQSFAPNLHEPLLTFLCGGLFGVVLFRLWMLVLTSFFGAMVAVYCMLGLAQHLLKADIQGLVQNKPGLLNLVVFVTVLGGVLIQGKFDTWRTTKEERTKTKAMKAMSDAEKDALKTVKGRSPIMKLIWPKKAS
jgi:hypothetical protein